LSAGAVKARLDCWDAEIESQRNLLEREVGVVVEEDRQAIGSVKLREGIGK
jgi:hypothetical protein